MNVADCSEPLKTSRADPRGLLRPQLVHKNVLKTRGRFRNDFAAQRQTYSGLMNAQKKWTIPIKDWGNALNQFAIHLEGRIEVSPKTPIHKISDTPSCWFFY